MADLAPIVLFVYNRPIHTRQVLESLQACSLSGESTLFIFFDGPKTNATAADLQNIEKTRSVIGEKQWCGTVNILTNEKNRGIDESIVAGVSQIIEQSGKVIVLEDDLIPANCFLEFMNQALTVYKDHKNVYSVNGFMFPTGYGKAETVLLPLTSSWGWATWKDRWTDFKFDAGNPIFLSGNSFINQRFNLPGINYAELMLRHKECWDINWYFHVFKRNGLGVFPSQTLIKNIGFDGSGVHCPDQEFAQDFSNATNLVCTTEKEINLTFYENYLNYFARQSPDKSNFSFIQRLFGKTRTVFKKGTNRSPLT